MSPEATDTMVITYCDRCGELMRATNHHDIGEVCPSCASGQHKAVRSRDSGQIPYALRPTSTAIMREIREHVKRV
jgi:hypothetical protein